MNVQKFKEYWEKIGRPARQFKSSSQPWLDVPDDNFDWFEDDDYRIKDDPHWKLKQKWIESDFTLPIEYKSQVGWLLCWPGDPPKWHAEYEYREAKQPISFNEQAECDQHGKNQHETGAKLDYGKNKVGLMINGFANALNAVSEVTTYGAEKYTPDGWVTVRDGVNRYTDAMLRHYMDEAMGNVLDEESGLMHAAHMAWNALARLELMLRDNDGR